MNDNGNMNIAATSVKLPTFWSQDPEIWFVSVESQFNTKNITVDQTRYDYLISALSPETAGEVRDVILNPPAANKYDALKTALISRTTTSQQKRIQQLLTEEELGDRKPTQLLRKMRQLVGNNTSIVGDGLLKTLFIQRLPPQIQAILATHDGLSLDQLGDLADKIIDITAITPPAISALNTPDLDGIKKEIAELRSLFSKSFNQNNSHNGRQRFRSTSRDRRGDPREQPPTRFQHSTPPTVNGLCWYHRKFGDQARKCTPECPRSNQGNTSAVQQ